MRKPLRICSLAAMFLLSLPAHADDHERETTGAAGLEFGVGFAGEIAREIPENKVEQDLATSWSITPWYEKAVGKVVGFGPELNFGWIKPDVEGGERRLTLSPHLRFRLSFELSPGIAFESFISAGLSWWTSTDQEGSLGDNRFGWGLRFGFGGSYAINRDVSAYMHLGYTTTNTWGGDISASADYVPLGVGLRALF
ncbi:MAG: outer membrane beta-barrel protein [Myxococcota bacterium]|nr:outer membrane beta-barrel protein [Myxococcota bacterium]